MYKIINLKEGQYLHLFSYDTVAGYKYYWHESLLCVDGSDGDCGEVVFPDHISPRDILRDAIRHYIDRKNMFMAILYNDYRQYDECEFEIIHCGCDV